MTCGSDRWRTASGRVQILGQGADTPGMRGPGAMADPSFWGRQREQHDGGWMQTLETPPRDDESDAESLEDVAHATSSDGVFEELVTLTPGEPRDEREPDDDALPPAASTGFDWTTSDDLLPTWSLDLG